MKNFGKKGFFGNKDSGQVRYEFFLKEVLHTELRYCIDRFIGL